MQPDASNVRKRVRTTCCAGLGAVAFLFLVAGESGATTRYVWLGGGHVAPFTSWATAATNIQDAVDVSVAGDVILVTNGIYNTGGRTLLYCELTNRVVINKAVVVQSVNGPASTVIAGAGPMGDAAVRCVYLGVNAMLIGFTLSNGCTRTVGPAMDQQGGGAWCEDSAVLSNCWIRNNQAYSSGGGVYGGTLLNCTLRTNTASFVSGSGGGAYGASLTNCVLQANASYRGGGAAYSRLHLCSLLDNRASDGAGGYGCTAEWCAFSGNEAISGGGGVCEGSVFNSRLYGNQARDGGGAYEAFLRNCVLANNTAQRRGGGSYGGDLYNCTLVDNLALIGGGSYSGRLYNSIVYYNRASRAPNGYNSTMDYCCTTPLPIFGENCLTNEPGLASDSHIGKESPCRGAGHAAYASDVDLDNEAWADPPSIGCDEYYSGGATGTLVVMADADATNAARHFPVHFRARIAGAVTESVWDFGDGSRVTNQFYVAHAFSGPGVYPVRLTAYNDTYVGGVSATVMVQVAEANQHYVRPNNPTPLPPYTNWATAATNIQQAIDAATQAGAQIIVSNGTYNTGGRVVSGNLTNRVVVNKPVMVTSVNGKAVTTIQGAGPLGDSAVRCVYLGEGATLYGFTLRDGATRTSGDSWLEQSGGGIWAEPGAKVEKCEIRSCSADDYGGGVMGGTLSDCTLVLNDADHGGGAAFGTLSVCDFDANTANLGGGATQCDLADCTLTANRAVTGGGAGDSCLERCLLKENGAESGGGTFQSLLFACTLSGNTSAIGGALASDWGFNCAIYGNRAGIGGGAYGSMLFNCTLTGNEATNFGGGLCDGLYHNCIIWDNMAPTGYNYATLFGGVGIQYSCSHPLPEGTGNLGEDPLFVVPGSGYGLSHTPGDYHLQSNSPCVNRGYNDSWMSVSGDPRSRDLDGEARIFGGGRVDMGAYEYQASVSCAPTNWLALYGLPLDGSADAEDYDGDGYTTCEEYVADTIPTSNKSHLPHMTNVSGTAVITATLAPTSTNRVYDIWSTTNLMAEPQLWVAHGLNLPGSPSNLVVVITNTVPQRFFRVGVHFP